MFTSQLPSLPSQFFQFLVLSTVITVAHCGFLNGALNVVAGGVCLFKDECCNVGSIPGDIPKLNQALRSHVYGQHIASNVVVSAIAAHWHTPHARKPLTMSFHGHTGSGKNHISNIIAESLYVKGMSSKYVKLFSPGIDFPHESEVDQYKKKLYTYVKEKVSDCQRQLFIFDEVEKMPSGVLDGIKAVLDYHDNVENVDYRQCIFIFLSNTGAKSITSHFLQLWREGRARENVRMSDFETMISQGAFNEDGKNWLAQIATFLGADTLWWHAYRLCVLLGGFFRSETIKNNLIDHYVPFLPMEREHVEMCIRLEFKIRGVACVAESAVEEVIDFIEWGPAPENKFAKTGCKRVSQKVAAVAFKLVNGQESRSDL